MLETIMSIFGWEPDESRSVRKSVYAPTVVNVNSGTASKDAPKETEPPKKWNVFPCPFCGGNVLTFTRQSIAVGGRHDGQHWVVFCEKCGAKSSLCPTKDEAVEMWNKPANEYNRLVRQVNDLEKEVENLKKASPESILKELDRQDGLFKSVQWTTAPKAAPRAKRKRPSCIGAGRRNARNV